MSFNQVEISDDEGRPIFLYSFTLGAAVWRYTSSDADVNYCLLYTSPSPRDRQKSRMPSSA